MVGEGVSEVLRAGTMRWYGTMPLCAACGVPTTRMRLVSHVWGPNLDPDWLTERTGIRPSRSFRVGERRGAAASVVGAGSGAAPTADDEPMFDALLGSRPTR